MAKNTCRDHTFTCVETQTDPTTKQVAFRKYEGGVVLSSPGTREKVHGAVLGQTPASDTSPGCIRDTVTSPTLAPTQTELSNTVAIAGVTVAVILMACMSGIWLYKYSGLLEKDL